MGNGHMEAGLLPSPESTPDFRSIKLYEVKTKLFAGGGARRSFHFSTSLRIVDKERDQFTPARCTASLSLLVEHVKKGHRFNSATQQDYSPR
mmetsp:Transcript_69035/g.143958  ORF Transcript_69035/g.143958 Transcript_69035/m.143958 type:complete len:92 (-) Transcript_69035:20-295(-)